MGQPAEAYITPEEYLRAERRADDRLILEAVPKKSLLDLLGSWTDLEEEFPKVDAGLLPLDDVEL